MPTLLYIIEAAIWFGKEFERRIKMDFFYLRLLKFHRLSGPLAITVFQIAIILSIAFNNSFRVELIVCLFKHAIELYLQLY